VTPRDGRVFLSEAASSILKNARDGEAISKGDKSMPFDTFLAERIREQLPRQRNLVEKKMFGGLGFMLNGNLLVCVWNESLIVRVGAEDYPEALLEPHVEEFAVTGRAMTGWVLIQPEGIEHEEGLSDWIARAIRFVETLPAK
jgi:TfoX/Sxy family transcriptional regulator of competence genes